MAHHSRRQTDRIIYLFLLIVLFTGLLTGQVPTAGNPPEIGRLSLLNQQIGEAGGSQAALRERVLWARGMRSAPAIVRSMDREPRSTFRGTRSRSACRLCCAAISVVARTFG